MSVRQIVKARFTCDSCGVKVDHETDGVDLPSIPYNWSTDWEQVGDPAVATCMKRTHYCPECSKSKEKAK